MIDGPFAETKEQLLGFYVVDVRRSRRGARGRARARRRQSGGAYRDPPAVYNAVERRRRGRHDRARLDQCGADGGAAPGGRRACCAISATSTRPRRPSRKLACAALKAWPRNGPPRDPTAWLILVGRNAALDDVRRRADRQPLPPEEMHLRSGGCRSRLAERLDGSHYRDDVLRLLFICCHPDLPATQQVALALRIVSGLR